MATKIFNEASNSNSTPSTQFNEYLNIELEVAPDVWIRMPLNCAIPRDDRNLTQDQKTLRDILLNKIEKASETGDKSNLQVKCAIRGSLYQRQASTSTDSTDWAAAI